MSGTVELLVNVFSKELIFYNRYMYLPLEMIILPNFFYPTVELLVNVFSKELIFYNRYMYLPLETSILPTFFYPPA
jgi:hypothetical protein